MYEYNIYQRRKKNIDIEYIDGTHSGAIRIRSLYRFFDFFHYYITLFDRILTNYNALMFSILIFVLTRLFICDFIETILKNFVKMHWFIITGRHFGIKLILVMMAGE